MAVFLFMFLMSTSMVLCQNFILFNHGIFQNSLSSHNTQSSVVSLTSGRRRLCGLIPNAKNGHSGKRAWWQKFFFDENGNWFGLKENDLLDDLDISGDDELTDGDKFEAWKRRAEAITELREAQEDMKNAESREWEDWLVEGTTEVNSSSWDQDWGDGLAESRKDVRADPNKMMPERGLVESVRDFILGKEDDDLLYEDRVFQYASSKSVSALNCLTPMAWTELLLLFSLILLRLYLGFDFHNLDYVMSIRRKT